MATFGAESTSLYIKIDWTRAITPETSTALLLRWVYRTDTLPSLVRCDPGPQDSFSFSLDTCAQVASLTH